MFRVNFIIPSLGIITIPYLYRVFRADFKGVKPEISYPEHMKRIIRHSAAEDAAITKAALEDPDSIPFTDEEWEKARPTMIRGRGNPMDHKANTPTTTKTNTSKLK
mgnify:FL=1|jgi:hypothetical protein